MANREMTKKRAAASIALNGLLILVVGGALLFVAVMALGNATPGLGALIVIGLLVYIAVKMPKKRKA